MGYLIDTERDTRLEKVRGIMRNKGLDIALVYYDEFNIGNGWYLTGWCPQFESGAVLVPLEGRPHAAGRPRERTVRQTGQRHRRNAQFPRVHGA